MCARTYIPVHNALAEALCCCFMFAKFHHDVGHQGVEFVHVSSTVFSFVSYMYIHITQYGSTVYIGMALV